MTTIHRIVAAVFVTALGTVASAGTISIQEVGSDVVVTGSGTFDTTDLTYVTDLTFFGALMLPDVASMNVGPPAASSLDVFSGVSGPASWSTTVSTFVPTSGTGDLFGIQGGASGFLFLPTGYTGTALSGQSTYAGQSFASMFLTPGTYDYTWGTGDHADSLRVQIGPVHAVPLPPAAWMGLGMLALIGLGRRRKRKHA